MIAGIFHKGSGLGNQLFRYVATRVLALDKGYDFSMINRKGFKGASFMNLDMGMPNDIEFKIEEPTGKVIPCSNLHLWEEKTNYYNPEIGSVEDNTIIDGEFQDEKYFIHRKDEIREWLKVGKLNLPKDLCLINFRGGEYVGIQELFLAQKYWDNAIINMLKVNPNIQFSVVTDDVKTARRFFPHFDISHNLKEDYVKIQNAYYLILSNSSFAILPAWLNQNVRMVIAPKYWARHNISDGYWSCEYNIMKGWVYQDRVGKLHDAESCQKSLKEYKENNIRDTTPIHIPYLSLRKRIISLMPRPIKNALKKIL